MGRKLLYHSHMPACQRWPKVYWPTATCIRLCVIQQGVGGHHRSGSIKSRILVARNLRAPNNECRYIQKRQTSAQTLRRKSRSALGNSVASVRDLSVSSFPSTSSEPPGYMHILLYSSIDCGLSINTSSEPSRLDRLITHK